MALKNKNLPMPSPMAAVGQSYHVSL
jgi:hypothetical protein